MIANGRSSVLALHRGKVTVALATISRKNYSSLHEMQYVYADNSCFIHITKYIHGCLNSILVECRFNGNQAMRMLAPKRMIRAIPRSLVTCLFAEMADQPKSSTMTLTRACTWTGITRPRNLAAMSIFFPYQKNRISACRPSFLSWRHIKR